MFQWTFGDVVEHLKDLDWLALVVAAIVLMVLGWLWYGPLFGKAWSKATGQTMESGTPPVRKLVATFA